MFVGRLGEYALWQTYLLYAGLIAFMLVGFNDGYYLRIADKSVDDSDRVSSVRVALMFVLTETSGMLALGIVALNNSTDRLLLGAILLNAPILAVYGIGLYTLYMDGGVARASVIVALERCTFVVFVAALWIADAVGAGSLVASDLAVRCGSAAIMLLYARGKLKGSISSLRAGLTEFVVAVRQGFPVMLASYIVTLVVSVVRIVVERTEAPETFAAYALAFSFASLLIVIGTALGTVIFPHLAGSDRKVLRAKYELIDDMMSFAVPMFMLTAFPLVWALRSLFAEYEGAADYVAPLVVVVVFQWIVAALNNNFYKLLGLQNQMVLDAAVALAGTLGLVLLLKGRVVAMTVAQSLILLLLVLCSQRRFHTAMGLGFRVTSLYNVWWGVALLVLLQIAPLGAAALAFVFAYVSFLVIHQRQARRLVSVLRRTS